MTLLGFNYKKYFVKNMYTYEYEYHISSVMEILIPSAVSVVTIFLILSSPSFLDMDRVLLFRHRSWTLWDNAILPSTTSSDDIGVFC